jgi:hypothetical protein
MQSQTEVEVHGRRYRLLLVDDGDLTRFTVSWLGEPWALASGTIAPIDSVSRILATAVRRARLGRDRDEGILLALLLIRSRARVVYDQPKPPLGDEVEARLLAAELDL